MRHFKTLPEASHMGLFATDVKPMLESMSTGDLRETAAGLRAILRAIADEPERRRKVIEGRAERENRISISKWIRETRTI